tara:strand:+ start:6159 stop:6701 length:543 start_codon:yes stop_codon:yes gene_type:complete
MQKKNLKNLNKNKILFLDRDGVINFDKGYLYKYEDLEYIPGIFDLCLYLTKKLKFKIIIITNQSGIGRGFYSEEKFHRLMKKIINDFKKRKIKILNYYFSPYYSKSSKKKYRSTKNFYKRKPNPGMVLEACEDYDIDIKKSVFIGDQKSDFLLSKKINLKFIPFNVKKYKSIFDIKKRFN